MEKKKETYQTDMHPERRKSNICPVTYTVNGFCRVCFSSAASDGNWFVFFCNLNWPANCVSPLSMPGSLRVPSMGDARENQSRKL